MKKIAAGFIVAGSLLVGFLLALIGIGTLGQEEVRQQPPLTLQEIDRIAESTAPAKKGMSAADTRQTPDSRRLDKTAGPLPVQQVAPERMDDDSPAKLTGASTAAVDPASVQPLVRVATGEQRLKFFEGRWSRKDRLLVRFVAGPLSSVLNLGDSPDGNVLMRANCSLMTGNWDEARSCFTQMLREDHGKMFQWGACAHLAWLEDDPALAARYMEIASSGVDWNAVLLSAELAAATGDKERARRYIARGRSLVADFDQKLEQYGMFAKGL